MSQEQGAQTRCPKTGMPSLSALSNSAMVIDRCRFMSIWDYFTCLESNSTPKSDINQSCQVFFKKKKTVNKYLLPPDEVGIDQEMFKASCLCNLYHQQLT